MINKSNLAAIKIRQMKPEDTKIIEELQKKALYPIKGWSAAQLVQHLSVFPEGQLVAEDETGNILGS